MAKLQACYPANQRDIIQLLHDEVVSLCQKNYSSVSGLEIDGIICISILDTKEQQVVKIHKTLKSVLADNNKRGKRQKIIEKPTFWLHGNSCNPGFPVEASGNNSENFQNDINVLSNLLRDTNAAIHRDLQQKSEGESSAKQSKRKRRQPKQKVTNNVEKFNDKNERHDMKSATVNNGQIYEGQMVEESNLVNSPGINPFIHKDVVKVKEEKIDPDYESAEHTQPKIVSVSSIVTDSDKDKNESGDIVMEQTKVSSIIDRLIEKAIPRERGVDRIEKSQERENVEKQDNINDNDEREHVENQDHVKGNEGCNGEEFQAVEVKVEKTYDESEYGGSCNDKDNFTGASSDTVGTGGSNSEAENFECPSDWLYNEKSSLGEVGRTALLDKLHEKGSLALTGYPREVGRVEQDPQGRSWIEMVKDNVNKYQAALERSGKVRSDIDKNTNLTSSSSVFATSGLAKGSSSLVALLKQPASNAAKQKEVTSNAILDSSRIARGSSVPIQGTDQIPERSTSVSPIVKIEVDDDMCHEIYSQSDSEVNGEYKNRNPITENLQDSKPLTTKVLPGKLESRYPALFSHLQQAKQSNVDNQDQSDSLVNRLPFISFQELFSQAPTGQTASGLSEATTMQLLAQARINPYPSKEKHKVQRKVWNWKKRQVRPRDADGKIISPIPTNVKAEKKKHLGLPSSVKKTFAKRGVRSEDDQDRDWQPEEHNIDIDSDNNDIVPNAVDTVNSPSRRTRLSCGEKPRVSFAEMDNSDIEMEEEEIDISPAPTVKHYTGNVNQHVYTERQGEVTSVFPGGSSEQLLAAFSARSEQLNSTSNAVAEQYKCSLCGLEFNQEYRWHYHLIKVHGITADKVKLFR